jgi:hypothetical protein
VVSIELKGNKASETAKMSVHILYKYSHFLKESEWQSDYLVLDPKNPQPLLIDSAVADKEDNYEVRDLFSGRLLEGDTILIYCHCIKSNQMEVVINLEFNPSGEEPKIRKLAKSMSIESVASTKNSINNMIIELEETNTALYQYYFKHIYNDDLMEI